MRSSAVWKMFSCLHPCRLLVWSHCGLPQSVCFPLLFGKLDLFFMCVGSWDWEAFFSAICSLPWHIAISKGCQDHCIFSQFDFQNCLSSSEPQSIWIWASRGLPVLSSLCIPFLPCCVEAILSWLRLSQYYLRVLWTLRWYRFQKTFPQEISLDIKNAFHSFCASAVLWWV